MDNNDKDDERVDLPIDTARPNEVGIFISDNNDYRIAVPREWNDKKEMPHYPYLAVAAVLRLATKGEEAFANELFKWAKEHALLNDPDVQHADNDAPQAPSAPKITYH